MKTVVLSLALSWSLMAQPPADPLALAATVTLFDTTAGPQPPAGSVEEAVAAALKNHPDVKIAEAKRMVADAELEQAKLLVAQKVTALYTKVQMGKLQVAAAEKNFEQVKVLHEAGTASSPQLTAAETALRTAKAELDTATAELQAAKGTVPKTVTNASSFDSTLLRSSLLTAAILDRTIPSGTAADKLRALVDRKIKLDLKPLLLADAMEALGGSSSGLTIRLPDTAKSDYVKKPPLVGPLNGEQTFAAWLQLILDDFSSPSHQGGMLEGSQGRYDAYVRDYGLLITQSKNAPQGAMTLADYVRRVHTESTKSPNPIAQPWSPLLPPKKK